MSDIRKELVRAAINRAYALIDYSVYNNAHKEYEFKKQTIIDDESLTDDEKSEAIEILTGYYDECKIVNNEGTKRICENCNKECLAILYCEYCVRNYLKANFSNWTSGNDNIDNLIQECQMKAISPYLIPEWIPYNNFQNVKYLTKGGFSEIYTADWINGHFIKWDSKEQQLKRIGESGFVQYVVLKRLDNVENANQSWFEEAKSHLTISNKWGEVVQCYGLTQDPLNGNLVLVILDFVDLADKPLKSIYGNLPYVAPEVIIGNEQTFKSDIYSIAMLMWEISSGQPPFINYEHNYDLAMNIVNGIRPKIVSGTPLEYKNLMKQCWDADSSKRPDTDTLWKKISGINLFYQIDDFGKSVNQRDSDTLINKDNSKILPQVFNELQINSSKTDTDVFINTITTEAFLIINYLNTKD
ncbi:kinase-like domain-containing protein [Rhizophagus irregularis DAOM 181602=DAOM 197198]|uniref:Kinase-like domain-containing protein n=1 Tax=Rhizophagus irregularis (strain DAOM 181602 / DAOM 197198 / MUCL 43194) TaxID=747089 RepID=A0A2P4QZD7_RHIID|nr:kinase-like domain-containing protein [Rhizophagus irregularis DAOM 181602=DAOM 197198]POG83009.1 kinase-like domain-containing protein [Rhizophagus irregularis DAOM 181602=DAOM 197198]|eukprot:XP_025189875.1 kinase-like domain-containing protein [Rhizophagus irregularis DAOM 181602=DAOM 197198]